MTAAGLTMETGGALVGHRVGQVLGGIIGEFFGPAGVPIGVMIGGRVGAVAGRAAGAYLASKMEKANEDVEEKTREGNPADVCSTCQPPKKPNRRHDPCRTRKGDFTKENNSMFDPENMDQFNREMDDIMAGRVPRTGNNYSVNGRTYGLHDGALYPESGPGIENVTRGSHQLLKQLNSRGYEEAMNWAGHLKKAGGITEDEIKAALKLWEKCSKNKTS